MNRAGIVIIGIGISFLSRARTVQDLSAEVGQSVQMIRESVANDRRMGQEKRAAAHDLIASLLEIYQKTVPKGVVGSGSLDGQWVSVQVPSDYEMHKDLLFSEQCDFQVMGNIVVASGQRYAVSAEDGNYRFRIISQDSVTEYRLRQISANCLYGGRANSILRTGQRITWTSYFLRRNKMLDQLLNEFQATAAGQAESEQRAKQIRRLERYARSSAMGARVNATSQRQLNSSYESMHRSLANEYETSFENTGDTDDAAKAMQHRELQEIWGR